ncbi:MAG: hypothetical protein ACRD7E_29300, partial [Bryobacteraceae bacterium]
MECMRSFLDKDRHVDGCWTGYSSSLERAVLKKLKFLEESEIPVRTEQVAEAGERGEDIAGPPTTPSQPVPQQFRPQSVFAERLQGALHKDS